MFQLFLIYILCISVLFDIKDLKKDPLTGLGYMFLYASFFHNFKEKRIDNQQIEVTLYRILQESTNNIIKYAEATHVDIQLKDYQDIYLLTVEDDGNGFKKSEDLDKKGGFGINGMRNRIAAIGGCFEIESSIGRGTTIIVEINKKDLK